MRAVPDEYLLDPLAVRRAFDAASATFDAAAAVHTEIRGRLLERLDLVRIEPRVVLDLGAGTGHSTRALQGRYPSARVIAIDISPGMLRESARQQRMLRRFARIAAAARAIPLRDASVDLVFSNLMLQWCNDPDETFREIRRALRPDGLLMFTTLGPDTLRELRTAWRSVDPHTHVHRFIDMHDLGDALLRTGFAEPVMDTERLTVTYPSVDALLRELRHTGSTNLAQGRRRGLVGRGSLQALRAAAMAAMREGTLPMTVEVVYGHAWAGELRPQRTKSGEIRVPFSALKAPRRLG